MNAHVMMKHLSALCDGGPEHTKALYKCKTLLVRKALGKPLGQVQYASIVDIGKEFFDVVNKDSELPLPECLVNKDGKLPPTPSTEPSTSSGGVANVAAFDAMGNVTGLARTILYQNGFVIGANIVHRENRQLYVIIDVSADGTVTANGLSLTREDIGKIDISLSDIQALYKVTNIQKITLLQILAETGKSVTSLFPVK